MAENDINLAALWVPVMAETSALKGRLIRAGTEAGAAGAVAMREAFAGGDILQGCRRMLSSSQVGVIAPELRCFKETIDKAKRLRLGSGSTLLASRRLSGLGVAIATTTKKAGNFQACQERLVASRGRDRKRDAGCLQWNPAVGRPGRVFSRATVGCDVQR